ncbi:MAG: hypothetical protein V2A53_05580 [bacterium]
MNNVHRTQICLEKWQYQFLRETAKERRCSIANILRELVNEKVNQRITIKKTDPLFEIVGIGEGDGSSIARNHDDYLYGEKDGKDIC